jgi:hypothetical protein
MPKFNSVADLMMLCACLDGDCAVCRLRDDCRRAYWRYMECNKAGLYKDLSDEHFTEALDVFATLFSRRVAYIEEQQQAEGLRARIRATEGQVIFRCED